MIKLSDLRPFVKAIASIAVWKIGEYLTKPNFSIVSQDSNKKDISSTLPRGRPATAIEVIISNLPEKARNFLKPAEKHLNAFFDFVFKTISACLFYDFIRKTIFMPILQKPNIVNYKPNPVSLKPIPAKLANQPLVKIAK